VRVADGDRRLTSYEVQLMIASRGQPRDDEEPVPDASEGDLEPDLARGLAKNLRSRSRNMADLEQVEILRTLKAVTTVDGRSVPTLAGLLALGTFPQRFFPALTAHFVVYPTGEVGAAGTDEARFVDNRRFEGSVGSILAQTMAALGQHMARRTLVRGARREDVWQYPETALREAIVNALVHRDLSSYARGTPVQIQMFPDRLVIVNPGGLFGPVTLDSLGVSGVSAARNATLMRLLEDTPGPDGAPPVCENRGSGIGAMISALRKAGLEPPHFDDRLATFGVTFPNASLLDEETVRWLERIGADALSETQRIGLALARHRHVLDNTLYRQTTGLDSRVATRELGDLVDKGLLDQVGTRRWATYRLSTAPGAKRRDRRAEIISLLRRRGDLSRSEIAGALELSDASARQWLATLRDEGHVAMIGPARSPNARYRLPPRKKAK